MAGKWGSSKNGCSVGVFFDDALEISGDGSQARVKGARLRFKSAVTVTESSNSWEWGGGVLTDGSQGTESFSGSGERTIRSLTGQWQTLEYGATKTAGYNATASGINYAGGTLTVSGSVTYPARAFDPPSVPGAVAGKRVSDTQQQVSWALAPTTAAPITSVIVERQQGSESAPAISVATLAGSTTSWADKSTVGNSRYRYRAKTRNTAGDSAWSAWSAWVATTPSIPSGLTTAKAGTTITVGWTNTASYRTGTPIEHSTDNGSSYTPETTAAAASVSYADTGLDVGLTHRYRLRHAITGVPLAAGGTTILVSAWVQSVNVQLSAPPNPPLVTVPPVLDLAITDLVIAVTHQSVDSTAQTAAEVRYRPVGDPTWTTQNLTTETSYTIPAGTLPNGVTYEVQARTKGEHPDFSAWSPSALMIGSSTPSVTVTSPADGATLTTSTTTYTWTFYDAEGGGQSSWEAQLLAGEMVVETAEGPGAASSWKPATAFSDGVTYTARVRGRDSTGLWSAWDEVTNPVDFLPPPMPELSGSFNADEGSVEIGIDVAAPIDGVEVEAVTAALERWTGDRWVLLADDMPILPEISTMEPDPDHPGLYIPNDGLTPDPDLTGLYLIGPDAGLIPDPDHPGLYLIASTGGTASIVDPIPPLNNEVVYRVTAYSDADTSRSETITVATEAACWVFLHAGPGWTTSAKLRANAQVSYTPDRPKILRTFYGGITREYPGESVTRQWQVSGDVATWPADEERIGGHDPWDAIASMPAPVCIRTPLGHRGFGSLSAIPQQSQAGSPHTGVSVTVTEVTYRE